MSDQPPTPAAPPTPAIRVVRGEPSAEEVAALVVVLAASAGGSPAPTRRSLWATHARVRSAHHAGPGAWRASALPR